MIEEVEVEQLELPVDGKPVFLQPSHLLLDALHVGFWTLNSDKIKQIADSDLDLVTGELKASELSLFDPL